MKKTQKDLVKEYLKEHGNISRNYCLSLRITRLGAIICDINKELEWDIKGKDKDGDYIYYLMDRPKQIKWVYELVDGVRKPKKILI